MQASLPAFFITICITLECRQQNQNSMIGTLVRISIVATFIGIFFGTYFKITHYEGADTLLAIGLIASLIFIITAIYEVNSSKRINGSEKVMWTIGFILTGSIAGLVYLFIGRKRVTESR